MKFCNYILFTKRPKAKSSPLLAVVELKETKNNKRLVLGYNFTKHTMMNFKFASNQKNDLMLYVLYVFVRIIPLTLILVVLFT